MNCRAKGLHIYTDEPKKLMQLCVCKHRDTVHKHSEYGAAVGNAYVITQVSFAGVISVTSAIMTGYHDLNEFKRGVIVDARWGT